MPRGLAVLTTYLLAVVVLLLSPLIFLPPIINGFNFLARIDYQILIDNSMVWLETTLVQLKDLGLGLGRFTVQVDTIIDPMLNFLRASEEQTITSFPSLETVVDSLRSAATVTVDLATNIAGTVFSGFITIVVLILSSIYISVDAHKFHHVFLEAAPPAYREELTILLRRTARTWRAYFRGQLILMLVIGVLTWLGTWMLGLRGAFALGVIAGVLELIPNLGPILAAIPAVIVALIQGSTVLPVSNWVFALIIIGFYILMQQFENSFVVPRVLGGAVDLHPLIVMVGVLVGANVAGIIGALLAAPIIATGREIIRYLYRKILGAPPFPPEPEIPQVRGPSLWTLTRSTIQTWYKRLRPKETAKQTDENA
jgi:predicted PurR-regulated permease PerM